MKPEATGLVSQGSRKGAKGRTGRRVLNLRAAVILGVILFGTLLGLDRLHSRQYGLTREFIRQRGLAAAAEGRYSSAAVLMEQYLAMRPGDVEIRAELSKILVEHVGTEAALQRAFRLNEDLLRDQIPQSDLRLRQARLALLLLKYSDAEDHLEILRTNLPESSEVWLMTGECQLATRHFDQAQQSFEKAIQCEPAAPRAYAALCRVISETQPHSPQISDLMYELKTRRRTVEAYQIHADWNLSRGQVFEAAVDLEAALGLSPDDLRTVGKLVQCLQQLPPSPQSKELLTRARENLTEQRKLRPQDVNLAVFESAVLWLQDDHAEASAVLEDAIRRSPRSFVLHRTLIEQLLNSHQPDAAEKILTGLPAGALSRSESEFLAGRIHVERGDFSSADACFELASAFCPDKSALLPRIQLAQAACRRQMGEGVHAADAYREVMTREPNSASGRLGMAAMYLESGQTDLAIAEYQQLLDQPGVPAYLANLIIQRNLELPLAVRKWTLVEELVSDTNPHIEDIVQRRLLQVDLLLAKGRIAEACQQLAAAREETPNRSELDRAVRRLNGEYGNAMAERLQKMLHYDPENTEIIAAIIRISLNQSTPDQAKTILDAALNELTPAGWNGIRRLQAFSQTVESIRSMNSLQGATSGNGVLDSFQLQLLEQLVSQVPDEFPRLIRALQLQNQTATAFEALIEADGQFPPEVVHLAGLEYVRFLPAGSACPTDFWTLMIRQIEAEPRNLALRRMYAEALLYVNQMEPAAATLEQLIAIDSHDAAAHARLAWIHAVSNRNQDALERIAAAKAADAHNPLVHIAYARVLIAEQKFDECLRELESLEQTFSGQSVTAVYLACAYDGLGQTELAKSWVTQARDRSGLEPLLPADANLLNALSAKLLPSAKLLLSAEPVTAGR